MAFDARADERETRGFISISTCRPVRGSTANWMFEPPVSTPIARMHGERGVAHALVLDGRSASCAGATVIESPVWTPIGSTFSIEQIDDGVVRGVAHHLELELLPAGEGLLDEDLGHGTGLEAAGATTGELGRVVRRTRSRRRRA